MANRKVKFDFNPLKGIRKGVTASKREKILTDVSDYVLETVLNEVGSQKSPVSGEKRGRWKPLSKEYAAFKRGKGASIANLELSGDLLDSLKVVRLKKGGLRLTVGDEEQKKADGHNNFTGKSKLPRRRFIPDANRGQKLRKKFEKEISQIVKDALEDEDDG